MADELEEIWKKLTLTEEEDEGITLDGDSTEAAREIGKNCLVMKILTQKSINTEALRKTMRMVWKPNKGVRISDIEEDLFLVEFGDKKDKQKVLDMCPWSYDKNLVLLQNFDGESAPKDIRLCRSPFWVQIHNLPLKSRTKQTGWMIGSKLGEVLEVDVPENGVQWGRYLRIRVKIDVTRKLVQGKKIKVENNEQRWVFFKYERLPNFCYLCGMLRHGEKECDKNDLSGNGEEKGAYQYDAWLRGEPGRRNSSDYRGNDGTGQGSRTPKNRQHNKQQDSHGLPLSHVAAEVGEPHMGGVVGNPSGASDTPVTHPKATPKLHNSDPTKSLAWSSEPVPAEGRDTKAELSQKHALPGGIVSSNPAKAKNLEESGIRRMMVTRDELAAKVLQATIKAEESQRVQLDYNNGPTPMIFENEVGWIDNSDGPKGRFWKRITRSGETKSPTHTTNGGAQKRDGPIPLQELDPNSISMK
ncbi:hypothetical protein SO802_017300 [Lithocarpus litseifolius]|uniref:CCHC-type domain-containing protein n=1 Tax=Lithocarpus litseifolius TaxID=425828 RepID=A0AAW2D1H1_9ROSI